MVWREDAFSSIKNYIQSLLNKIDDLEKQIEELESGETMTITETIWFIMSKDRKLIAKGVPRNRYLCHIDENDKKRFLTYSSEGKARSGFEDNGFYTTDIAMDHIKENNLLDDKGYYIDDKFLEPVKCIVTYEISDS